MITQVNKGNGYKLDIQHTYPYSTQYKYLSHLAKGIKRGVRVKQGDLIGYVGKKSIALNFRRKNKTIDRSELNTPSEENTSINENKRKDFDLLKEKMILRLRKIPLSDHDKQLLSYR